MRYLDSGQREPSQALGTWLQDVMAEDISEVRWQSGFFVADSLGIVQSALKGMASKDRRVHALIGSNDQCTIRRDVERLVSVLGIPRKRAQLGVVSYQDGYYHPKTFHVRRADGSQAAYVGSANLTGSGVASLHIEAGITVDSREGDSTDILDEVASAVDFWFSSVPPGLHRVSSLSDVEQLVKEGILTEAAPPRPTLPKPTAEGKTRPTLKDRLQPLIALPRLEELVREARAAIVEAAPPRTILLPVAPRASFPPYLLFAPGQGTPTQGAVALSGSSLPIGAAGLIIRLNRDSARHFEGRPGTANFSVPVPTLSTLRFGLYPDRYPRPRAEFPMRIRYLTNEAAILIEATETNIMAYGFIPGEAGHGDVRMLMPAAVKTLAQRVKGAGRALPKKGDVALLEWPTLNDKREFRLSFLDHKSTLFSQADSLFRQAQNSNATVGKGACWLPDDLSPPWP
jgi:hypothetical protein